MRSDAAQTEVLSIRVLGLTMTKSIEVLNPTVVRIGFAFIHLCDQEQIYGFMVVVFCGVEGVDSSTFGIAKDVDGQAVQPFDV